MDYNRSIEKKIFNPKIINYFFGSLNYTLTFFRIFLITYLYYIKKILKNLLISNI